MAAGVHTGYTRAFNIGFSAIAFVIWIYPSGVDLWTKPSPLIRRISERAELELVLAALARTPRLESFLRYIAERYFQNRINEINEYNIATEVLGRSKTLSMPLGIPSRASRLIGSERG